MTILTFPPNGDLSTLNVFVAQQENFLRGELRAVSSDGDVTILDFDDEKGDRPKANTVLTTGSPPPGARVVGSARIYLANKPALAIAYRPESPQTA